MARCPTRLPHHNAPLSHTARNTTTFFDGCFLVRCPLPPVFVFQAHAHFIGIDPAHRGARLGARLYEHFFQAVKARGCTLVHAVTSPVNTTSVAFHKALGFDTVRIASSRGKGEDRARTRSDAGPRTGDGVVAGGRGLEDGRAERGAPVDGEFVHVGYDGPDDGDRVLMEMRL